MDSDFIRELRTFGISEIMSRNGYVPLISKAIEWDTSRCAIRNMINRNIIKRHEVVRVGQEIYLKKSLEKPTRKYTRRKEGIGK